MNYRQAIRSPELIRRFKFVGGTKFCAPARTTPPAVEHSSVYVSANANAGHHPDYYIAIRTLTTEGNLRARSNDRAKPGSEADKLLLLPAKPRTETASKVLVLGRTNNK